MFNHSSMVLSITGQLCTYLHTLTSEDKHTQLTAWCSLTLRTTEHPCSLESAFCSIIQVIPVSLYLYPSRFTKALMETLRQQFKELLASSPRHCEINLGMAWGRGWRTATYRTLLCTPSSQHLGWVADIQVKRWWADEEASRLSFSL